ncbi:MAG: DUF2914 domain-containing protein [bacterium]
MRFHGKLFAGLIACLLLIAGAAIAEDPATTKATKTEKVTEATEHAPTTQAAPAEHAQTTQAAPAERAETPPAAQAQTAEAEHHAAPGGMEISKIAICQEVQERTPVGEADSFSNQIGQLTCFTRVQNAEAPTQIFHRWYVGDEMVEEIAINVRGEQWRCWSTKTIQPGWTGTCRVEILTESGDVISTKTFQLEGSSAG